MAMKPMASFDNLAKPLWIRPTIRGKYFFIGEQKIYLRGISFGPFASRSGEELGNPEVVARDFRRMQSLNINCIRIHTVPEQWFLDLCQEYDLHVLVGIPWPQHVAFLDDSSLIKNIEATVSGAIRRHSGHPFVLAYVIGNEIPASIVRWHGPQKMERFLHRLYMAAKVADPNALITYANYPTTEYLHTPFLDFISFNIYLERREDLQKYLYRLQNISGDLPLIITEFGLDTTRNGEELQAEFLNWQIKDLYAAGCAGGFIFSWTDEWHRGGERIEDWKFGITTHDRNPKKAVDAVKAAYAYAPLGKDQTFPSISVVVCVYNGQETIRQCLQALSKLNYPNYEVIIVDDGSRDSTAEMVAEFTKNHKFRLFRTENHGLSMARNLGIERARGEIIAFIDSDAYPDPDWLRYFAADFARSNYSALGGPNIPDPDAGRVSPCVAASPGWPTHVLLSDRDAEHIPGCNMAFRKEILKKIGGFDPRFSVAGDDVDICWRITAQRHSIGFCHGAVVRHYPRRTVRAYWKQQKNYGAAEALLERKWPERYNSPGQIIWSGKIYNGYPQRRRNEHIYHGFLGMSPFQSIYSPKTKDSFLSGLAPFYSYFASADLNAATGLLIILSLLSPLWHPLWICVLLLAIRLSFQLGHALSAARAASRRMGLGEFRQKQGFILITTLLHLIQPVARTFGRMRNAWRPLLSPKSLAFLPFHRTATIWNEKSQQPEAVLINLESRLLDQASVWRGGGFDSWDLQIQTSTTGSVRMRMAFEEHEKGKQLIRIRWWPYWRPSMIFAILCTGFLSALAAIDNSFSASIMLGLVAATLAVHSVLDSACAAGLVLKTFKSITGRQE